MPIAKPDCTEGAVTDDLEGSVGAGGTALGATNEKFIILDRDGGYSENRDRLLGWMLDVIAVWEGVMLYAV